MIKLESDVPLPAGTTRLKNCSVELQPKYPFRDMKVGDSFEIEGSARYTLANRVRSAAKYYCRTNRAQFIVRTTEAGVRCWRIE